MSNSTKNTAKNSTKNTADTAQAEQANNIATKNTADTAQAEQANNIAITDTADTAQAFEQLEKIDSFKAGLALSQAAIELSAPVIAGELVSAEKARLTMLNRVNRCKRFVKIQKLNDNALSIISTNTTPEKIETTAIYAVDKVIQIAAFLAGNGEVFGRGKNNTVLYLLRGIATHSPAIVSREFAINSLRRYGQPAESADTQASSSCKALLALGCLEQIKPGHYTVTKSPLMTLLINAAQ